MTYLVLSNIVLTNGESLWLWRKREGLTPAAAAQGLKVSRSNYLKSELDETTDVLGEDIVPTQQELVRILRRRSHLNRDELARKAGISHVTWLSWEKSDPVNPKLIEFWEKYT